MKIKLNCDMGESFGIWKTTSDESIMPHIDMANFACGFHASDALTMQKSVQLAKQYNKIIGAHPGYQDLVGFGRRCINCSNDEIYAITLYQIGALNAFCKANNTKVSYVKPHGALYNDMMKDESIFRAILNAISSYDCKMKLMILSTKNNEYNNQIAHEYGINLLYEVFADRNYMDDGKLVSRNSENAIINDEKLVLDRINTLIEDGYLLSENGEKLFLQADTICVHGDNDKALNFIKILKTVLS